MNDEVLETRLLDALNRLEVSSEKIVQTRGYTHEVENLRILTELIKEQLKNENISSSTSTIR